MAGASKGSLPPYPRREPYFAMKLIRLFATSGAAQELGSDVFALIATVAAVEDGVRYSGPVTFFNEALARCLGISTWRRLDKARQKAIDAGWLFYRGDSFGHKPGLYFTAIPRNLVAICDLPESVSIGQFDISTDLSTSTSGISICHPIGQSDISTDLSTSTSTDTTFIPTPDPLPTPSPPTPLAVVEAAEKFSGGGEEEAWRSFEAELRNLGMVATREPIANLREQGISSEEAREIVEFWRAKPTDYWPDRIQALRSKLMRAVREEDVDAAWLLPAERYLRTDRERRAEVQRQERIRAAEESERSREAGNHSRLETSGALEEQFGPTLDALTRDEREDLINLACPSMAARQLYRTYWNRPGVQRNALLKRLAETATNRA